MKTLACSIVYDGFTIVTGIEEFAQCTTIYFLFFVVVGDT